MPYIQCHYKDTSVRWKWNGSHGNREKHSDDKWFGIMMRTQAAAASPFPHKQYLLHYMEWFAFLDSHTCWFRKFTTHTYMMSLHKNATNSWIRFFHIVLQCWRKSTRPISSISGTSELNTFRLFLLSTHLLNGIPQQRWRTCCLIHRLLMPASAFVYTFTPVIGNKLKRINFIPSYSFHHHLII